MTSDSDKTTRIRDLNDKARIQPETVNATWMLTRGVVHLLAGDDDTPSAIARTMERSLLLRRAIATYADWREGNDPYGEHDFGAFDFLGEKLFFKIDYFHPDHDTHAPDPASIELCRRVLTVMLAEEY